jgi:hypothetical protein
MEISEKICKYSRKLGSFWSKYKTKQIFNINTKEKFHKLDRISDSAEILGEFSVSEINLSKYLDKAEEKIQRMNKISTAKFNAKKKLKFQNKAKESLYKTQIAKEIYSFRVLNNSERKLIKCKKVSLRKKKNFERF